MRAGWGRMEGSSHAPGRARVALRTRQGIRTRAMGTQHHPQSTLRILEGQQFKGICPRTFPYMTDEFPDPNPSQRPTHAPLPCTGSHLARVVPPAFSLASLPCAVSLAFPPPASNVNLTLCRSLIKSKKKVVNVLRARTTLSKLSAIKTITILARAS